MNEQERLYYLACGFGFYALSGFGSLFDDEYGEDAIELGDELDIRCKEVLTWMIRENVHGELIEPLFQEYRAIERYGDEFGTTCITYIRSQVQEWMALFPDQHRTWVLYYYNMGWALQTLDAFQAFMEELRDAVPSRYAAYVAQHPAFERLRQWIDAELTYIGIRTGLATARTTHLQRFVMDTGHRLATYWRETVTHAAAQT